MSAAWKRLELRICRALGGERRGPTGKTCSDCDDRVPWAVEIKRSARGVPEGRWIEQAKRHGKTEGKPWLLVVGRPNSPRPVAVLDFWHFSRMCVALGLVGRLEPVNTAALVARLEDACDPSSPIDLDAHVAGVIDDLDRKNIEPGRRAASVPPAEEIPQIAIFR